MPASNIPKRRSLSKHPQPFWLAGWEYANARTTWWREPVLALPRFGPQEEKASVKCGLILLYSKTHPYPDSRSEPQSGRN